MISKKFTSAVFGALVCLLCFAGIAAADPLTGIEFIMIAVNDAKATIKNADGSLQIIQPGTVIADTYTVKSIIPGRITLENSAADGPAGVIVRLEYGRQWLEFLAHNLPPFNQLDSQDAGSSLPETPVQQQL